MISIGDKELVEDDVRNMIVQEVFRMFTDCTIRLKDFKEYEITIILVRF